MAYASQTDCVVGGGERRGTKRVRCLEPPHLAVPTVEEGNPDDDVIRETPKVPAIVGRKHKGGEGTHSHNQTLRLQLVGNSNARHGISHSLLAGPNLQTQA